MDDENKPIQKQTNYLNIDKTSAKPMPERTQKDGVQVDLRWKLLFKIGDMKTIVPLTSIDGGWAWGGMINNRLWQLISINSVATPQGYRVATR